MDNQGIRPETLALDALIAATIERVEQTAVNPHADTMLFLGNQHASFPTLVVKDPVLEPVDKLVWMAIMLQANETGGHTAFPSYTYIAKTANVSSTATIARAVSILRTTRWLTLCARVREASGRYRGNVFALHDEPLPLVDALHLDAGYMQFLRESAGHRHARVCTVARGVLETIDEDIQAGRDVCADEHPHQRRMQAAAAVDGHSTGRFFAFSSKVMNQLGSDSEGRCEPKDQGQNLKAVGEGVQNLHPQILHPQNLKSGSCSSSYINKTTTTRNSARENFAPGAENDGPLIYPGRLTNNQRDLADRYLGTLSPDQRQPILDELEGRIRSEQKGMTPLYDEISYLSFLCKAMKNREFTANLGIKVCEERVAREKAREKRKHPPETRTTANIQAMRQQIEAGEGPLSDMRRVLGKSCRNGQENPPDDT